jgi:hypothetical protein
MNSHSSQYKNEFFEIKFGSDYIVEINVFDKTYNKLLVTDIVQTVMKLTGGKEYLILVVADKNSRVSLGAVNYLSSSTAMKYALAKAYVINSRHQKLMANLFSTFLKPRESIRFFNTREEAIHWLKALIAPAVET